jgi:hypothetical protein
MKCCEKKKRGKHKLKTKMRGDGMDFVCCDLKFQLLLLLICLGLCNNCVAAGGHHRWRLLMSRNADLKFLIIFLFTFY